MFKDHPWCGIGLGNYPSAYLAYKVGAGQHTLFAHNFFLGLLAETGFLGVGGLLFFFFTWFRSLRLHGDVLKERSPYLIGLCMVTLFCLVNIGLEIFVNLLVFWMFAGI